MAGATLNTEGATISGTPTDLEAWDTIQYSDNEPLSPVELVLTEGGELDISDELDTGLDPDGDGVNDDRSATVWASDAGNTIVTGSGEDRLFGGLGDDNLIDLEGGFNLLDGGAGADHLESTDGSELRGGEGDDQLIISTPGYAHGSSVIDGGDGDDTIIIDAGVSGTVDGGAGHDTLIASQGLSEGLTITNVEVLKIQDSETTPFQATVDQLDGFDSIQDADDPTAGLEIELQSGGMLDLSDKLDTGLDSDGDGATEDRAVTIRAYYDGGTIITGSGDDSLHGSMGSDILIGGAGNDNLTDVEGGMNLLDGGEGDDHLSIQYGSGILLGGDGDDTFTIASDTSGMIDGGAGHDVLLAADGLSGALEVTNVEVLKIQGGWGSFLATAAQLEGFDSIEDADDPTAGLEIGLTGAGELDLSDQLDTGLDADSNGVTEDRAVTVWASDEGNTITTGSGNDILSGGEGDDTLRGGAGDDYLHDHAYGWGTTNLLDGGAGDDMIEAYNSNATVNGGAGDDMIAVDESVAVIDGGDGNDTMAVGYSSGTVDGGAGDDTIYAHNSNVTLNGGAGQDTIQAIDSEVTIDGGDGNDTIEVEYSSGTVAGGDGDDIIEADDFSGTIDGGTGIDSLRTYGDISGSEVILTSVEVLALKYDYIEATAAQLDGFDRIEGAYDSDELEITLVGAGAADLSDELGGQAVRIFASDLGNVLTTGSGDDTLQGGEGDDTLRGGDGDDTINGNSYGEGSGTDILDGGAGRDTFHIDRNASGEVDGGSGEDVLIALGDISSQLMVQNVETLQATGQIQATAATLDGFDSIELENDNGALLQIELIGTGVADLSDKLGDLAVRITASSLGNTIVTGSGDDILVGGLGADLLAGGAGDDRISAGGGDDVLRGGDGADILNGGRGTNTASYAGNTGVTVALDGSLTATEDAIGDTFAGIANLIGSSDNDRLRGNDSANLIEGGAGNDRLEGREDDDILVGGAGADRLDGGADIDTASYAGGSAVKVALDGSLAALGDALGDTFNLIENLTGSSGQDRLRGDALANVLAGEDGSDRLEGMAGNDTLRGGNGDDVLTGGFGQDRHDGGVGFDDFVFASVAESGPASTSRDIIDGFAKGQDDIVVSAIDANLGVAGNQAFVLDSNGSFSAGEIRQKVVSGNLLLEFNVDADATVEMAILLNGVGSALGAGDFVL